MFRDRARFFQEARNHFESVVLGGDIVAEAGDPVHALFSAKPGPLALGVLAGADAHFFDGLRV